jgi:hypothetical protein
MAGALTTTLPELVTVKERVTVELVDTTTGPKSIAEALREIAGRETPVPL